MDQVLSSHCSAKTAGISIMAFYRETNDGSTALCVLDAMSSRDFYPHCSDTGGSMERGVPYPRGVGLAIAAEIIEMSPDPHRNAFCGDDPKLLIQGSAGNKIQEEI